MAETGSKSSLRTVSGPHVVEGSIGRNKGRTNARRRGIHQDSEKAHSKRSTKKDSSQRRVKPNIVSEPVRVEPPRVGLEVVGQPAKAIQLGMPVDTSVMVIAKPSHPDQVVNVDEFNTASLFAVATLITEDMDGNALQLEAGALMGPQLFESVHPMPKEYRQMFHAEEGPGVQRALGYFAFSGLVIRQPGTYRIRFTLIQMENPITTGAMSLFAVDSEPVRVERRPSTSLKRQQRVCSP